MIRFQLSENAIKPSRSGDSTGNAGIDIHANLMDGGWTKVTKDGSQQGSGAIWLKPRERCVIPTGIKAMVSEDLYLRVSDRSGNAVKNGIHCIAGVVDSSYRGEIKVAIVNLGFVPISIAHGAKIAQLIPTKISNELIEFGELDETDRGAKGGINE